MIAQYILILLIGALATTIGAVPLGLVNLSVADMAIKVNIRQSMSLAFGAAIIEILFAVTAQQAGSLLSHLIEANSELKYSVLAILLFSGVSFWFKKVKWKSGKPSLLPMFF
jgi:threonine/homoserine/homoserine lactone efflux protein